MRLRFYQEGGAAQPAGGGQDPLQQLVEMAMQAVQNNDANLALQVCQGLIQLVQQAMQQREAQEGGGAGAGGYEGGAEEGGYEAEPGEEGEPVYRFGGRLCGCLKRGF